MSSDDDFSNEIEITDNDDASYAVLPLRDIVVFPQMVVPLFVGREQSINALETVIAGDSQILLLTQKKSSVSNPSFSELHSVGTLANVLHVLKIPDGTIKLLVEGQSRVHVGEAVEKEGYLACNVSEFDEILGDDSEIEALKREAVARFEKYAEYNKSLGSDALASVVEIEEPSKLCDNIAGNLNIKIDTKQELLEISDVAKRLEKLVSILESEISVLQVERKIRGRVRRQLEKSQRDYYLNEQMKAIMNELGEGEGGKDETAELEARVNKAKLSKEAKEKANAELKKLKQMNSMSAEATVVRNYLDWMLALPWGKRAKLKRSITEAREVLDSHHHALDKIKERVIEYLAVNQRTNKLRGPILCLVGPPGVGKTSLGKSVAEATGREFVRVSLGGVRDEAEIRGHRRTYIGSMPGRIIQSLKKVKTTNPLFLLDEIDKMGSDFRGDPASALLEVLDPEQNKNFNDHYLEVDYDLSDIMFITTANTLELPRALLDRMEIVRIAGYTEEEKVAIAKEHLIPKITKDHGLKDNEWSISDEVLFHIIRNYTREAGVRNLERELCALARKTITKILSQKEIHNIDFTTDLATEFLGVPKVSNSDFDREDQVGIATGIAWTEVGGEVLTVEGVSMPGKGNLAVTGNLRDVMKESASAANAWVRSHASELGITTDKFNSTDVHVHVPEGATPKDGPSAGVAMVTTLVSALTGIPVRRDVAMTGEITLRGRVLPIGGLKEKLLAVRREKLRQVLIPADNLKDLADISQEVKEDLDIVPIKFIREVLEHALTSMPNPIDADEALGEKTEADLLPSDTDQEKDIPNNPSSITAH